MQQSLKDLGVDQLDLLLLHWPEAWLPGSDPNGEVHPDTSVTLLEAWCVTHGGVPVLVWCRIRHAGVVLVCILPKQCSGTVASHSQPPQRL